MRGKKKKKRKSEKKVTDFGSRIGLARRTNTSSAVPKHVGKYFPETSTKKSFPFTKCSTKISSRGSLPLLSFGAVRLSTRTVMEIKIFSPGRSIPFVGLTQFQGLQIVVSSSLGINWNWSKT